MPGTERLSRARKTSSTMDRRARVPKNRPDDDIYSLSNDKDQKMSDTKVSPKEIIYTVEIHCVNALHIQLMSF